MPTSALIGRVKCVVLCAEMCCMSCCEASPFLERCADIPLGTLNRAALSLDEGFLNRLGRILYQKCRQRRWWDPSWGRRVVGSACRGVDLSWGQLALPTASSRRSCSAAGGQSCSAASGPSTAHRRSVGGRSAVGRQSAGSRSAVGRRSVRRSVSDRFGGRSAAPPVPVDRPVDLRTSQMKLGFAAREVPFAMK